MTARTYYIDYSAEGLIAEDRVGVRASGDAAMYELAVRGLMETAGGMIELGTQEYCATVKDADRNALFTVAVSVCCKIRDSLQLIAPVTSQGS